jgi:site-specific DNA-methyltransferase (adenine-specific)
MNKIPDGSVDCIITDLPYGTTDCAWDLTIPFEPLWEHYWRVIKPNGAVVLFGIQPFTSSLIMSCLDSFRYCWAWKSNRACNFAQAPYMPLKNIEDIAVFSKATIAQNSKNRMVYNPQGVFEVSKTCGGKKANDHRPNRADQDDYTQTKAGYPTVLLEFSKESEAIHPTQKPIKLLEYLIKTYSNEKETILDSCMGSGSTCIAAINTNRNFIGIEKDNAYFKLAKDRIAQHLENRPKTIAWK